MDASANNNIWAAGSSGKVIRFNGTTWVSHSIPSGGNLTLRGITVLSPSDVWVAGDASVGLGAFRPCARALERFALDELPNEQLRFGSVPAAYRL